MGTNDLFEGRYFLRDDSAEMALPPWECLLRWFEGLPSGLRDDLASRIMLMESPQGWFSADEDTLNYGETFGREVRAVCEREANFTPRAAGFVAAIAGIIDLVMVPNRRRSIGFCTPEFRPASWKIAMLTLEDLLARAVAEGDERRRELWSGLLAKMPLRKQEWERTSSEWAALRAGQLSAVRIDAWIDEEMRKRFDHGSPRG